MFWNLVAILIVWHKTFWHKNEYANNITYNVELAGVCAIVVQYMFNIFYLEEKSLTLFGINRKRSLGLSVFVLFFLFRLLLRLFDKKTGHGV